MIRIKKLKRKMKITSILNDQQKIAVGMHNISMNFHTNYFAQFE